ncbi:fumarylacetoacetate hydrolase family protein [Poseidonocella sp. HB161398]|uniref:fumarylacetoacetate hydrolase family protein n=1 Tax=Poseidonocella sp. HB161398 TaxID=2320855 RepID=UPI001108205E|nr:fumarylacetoacetate hydrolase family protein [Poseidonocella sp. HB161398]
MPQDTIFAVAPPVPVTLPVAGEEAVFPVGRLFCIGRNYAAHAAEMGHDSSREPPFFFMKPNTAVCPPGTDFLYPRHSSDVHHEVEMVAAIGTGGSHIEVADALSHVWGYGVGLDMTLRDIQATAKSMGRPWETAKAVDGSAPVGAIHPVAETGHPVSGAITLAVNGNIKQRGDLSQMIWSIPEMIAHISKSFTLRPGDLIMTGTPSGVGPVLMGDLLEGTVEGVGTVSVKVR